MIFKRREKKEQRSGTITAGKFRDNIVLDSRCRYITDKYEICKILGEGRTGRVSSAHKVKATYDKRNDPPPAETVAMKTAIIPKSNDLRSVDALRREIDLLKKLDHPNVVKCYEVYKTCDRNIHCALQYCSGGNLYSRFPTSSEGERVPFTEEGTARIIYQLLSSLEHVHQSGIIHRDVKFENILFDHTESNILNLMDFGAGCMFQRKSYLTDPIGTIYTMAPEVHIGKYNEKVDLWSVGVITFMMLSLTKPFYGATKREVIKKVMKGDVKFYSPRWKNVSSASKMFIKALLNKDPAERPSARKAMQHDWLSEIYPSSERNVTEDKLSSIHDSILQYRNYADVVKVGLNIIAHQITADSVWDLREAFDFFDKNKNGTLTFPDFTSMMRMVNTNYSIDEMKDVFHKVTIDSQSKVLHFTEFLAAALLVHKEVVTRERLYRVFDRLDHEAKGRISMQNLREILGIDYSESRITLFWESHDFGSGISFDDYFLLFVDFIPH